MAYLEYVHVQPRSENLLLALGSALDFTAADLMANRAGKLHKQQFTRLVRTDVAYSLGSVVLSLSVALFLRIGWLLGVEDRSAWKFVLAMFSDPSTVLRQAVGGMEREMPILFWVILLIFPLVAIKFAMKVPWKLVADLVSRKVACESGLVANRWDERRLRGVRGREGDLVSRYEYIVNNKSFQVSRAAFEALAPSLDYNIYCLPLSRLVVSVEPKEAATKEFDPAAKGFKLVTKHA